jgi:hypothetical protein
MWPSGLERREALLNLERFVDRGGRVDVARIPHHKPAVRSFFLAEDGHIWVERTDRDDPERPAFDVFNPVGQYLGVATLPFRVRRYPSPVVREGVFFGVAQDEFDVQFVVRARIEY